jgi:hypothetical protein
VIRTDVGRLELLTPPLVPAAPEPEFAVTHVGCCRARPTKCCGSRRQASCGLVTPGTERQMLASSGKSAISLRSPSSSRTSRSDT